VSDTGLVDEDALEALATRIEQVEGRADMIATELQERILVLEYQAQMTGLVVSLLKGMLATENVSEEAINIALDHAADLAEQVALTGNPEHAEHIRRAVDNGMRNLTREDDGASRAAMGAVLAEPGGSGAN